jgi:ribosome recycling factor
VVNNRMEETRVQIRNIRRDQIKDIREFEDEGLISEDDEERGKKELQEWTDKFNDKVGDIGERKENEIMEV